MSHIWRRGAGSHSSDAWCELCNCDFDPTLIGQSCIGATRARALAAFPPVASLLRSPSAPPADIPMPSAPLDSMPDLASYGGQMPLDSKHITTGSYLQPQLSNIASLDPVPFIPSLSSAAAFPVTVEPPLSSPEPAPLPFIPSLSTPFPPSTSPEAGFPSSSSSLPYPSSFSSSNGLSYQAPRPFQNNYPQGYVPTPGYMSPRYSNSGQEDESEAPPPWEWSRVEEEAEADEERETEQRAANNLREERRKGKRAGRHSGRESAHDHTGNEAGVSDHSRGVLKEPRLRASAASKALHESRSRGDLSDAPHINKNLPRWGLKMKQDFDTVSVTSMKVEVGSTRRPHTRRTAGLASEASISVEVGDSFAYSGFGEGRLDALREPASSSSSSSSSALATRAVEGDFDTTGSVTSMRVEVGSSKSIPFDQESTSTSFLRDGGSSTPSSSSSAAPSLSLPAVVASVTAEEVEKRREEESEDWTAELRRKSKPKERVRAANRQGGKTGRSKQSRFPPGVAGIKVVVPGKEDHVCTVVLAPGVPAEEAKKLLEAYFKCGDRLVGLKDPSTQKVASLETLLQRPAVHQNTTYQLVVSDFSLSSKQTSRVQVPNGHRRVEDEGRKQRRKKWLQSLPEGKSTAPEQEEEKEQQEQQAEAFPVQFPDKLPALSPPQSAPHAASPTSTSPKSSSPSSSAPLSADRTSHNPVRVCVLCGGKSGGIEGPSLCPCRQAKMDAATETRKTPVPRPEGSNYTECIDCKRWYPADKNQTVHGCPCVIAQYKTIKRIKAEEAAAKRATEGLAGKEADTSLSNKAIDILVSDRSILDASRSVLQTGKSVLVKRIEVKGDKCVPVPVEADQGGPAIILHTTPP